MNKTTKRKFNICICLLCYVALMLTEYLIITMSDFSQMDEYNVTKFFAIMSTINLIVEISMILLLKLGLFTPASLFVMLNYLFHFGQVVMNGLFSNYKYDYYDYVEKMFEARDAAIKTMELSLWIINFTFLGILAFYFFSNDNNSIPVNQHSQREICRHVGQVLFLISTPLRFFIDGKMLINAYLGGYSSTWSLGLPGIFTTIASFWYASMIFLYLGYGKKKDFIYFAVLYGFVVMLTGSRGHQMVNLIVVLVIFIMAESKKVSLIRFLLYVILGYAALVFIDVIMLIRGAGIEYFFTHAGECISNSLRVNILFETMGSFGETIFTPFLVVEQKGTVLNPFWGEGFLYSLVSLVPDIGDLFSYYNHASIFQKMIDTQHAIGGSYIGELYYNFGQQCYIIAGLVGIGFGFISKKMRDAFNQNNYIAIIYITPIFINVLWWVRDSIGNELRLIIWQILISWIIIKIEEQRDCNFEPYDIQEG
ncbi:MAG: O-antigen polysaccharide polymerase Wzy family protein [Clostridium sp.]|nr:O-antigen polysaccharide polymerase Wzy family protein [Clostridium sp.]